MDSRNDGFVVLTLCAKAPAGVAGVKFLSRFVVRRAMKIRNSLKSLKSRHRDCRVIRRKGRIYVINKTQRRFKARQG